MPRIRSDGRDWDFKPGKNGSLTSVDKQPMGTLSFPEHPKVAKVITNPQLVQDEQARKRVAMNIANRMMGKSTQ